MSTGTLADGVFILKERLDIAGAEALRAAILAADGDLTVDAGSVHLLTTPGLQVLMAGRDHQAARGHALRVEPVSAGFRACLRTLGVPLERLQTGGTPA